MNQQPHDPLWERGLAGAEAEGRGDPLLADLERVLAPHAFKPTRPPMPEPAPTLTPTTTPVIGSITTPMGSWRWSIAAMIALGAVAVYLAQPPSSTPTPTPPTPQPTPTPTPGLLALGPGSTAVASPVGAATLEADGTVRLSRGGSLTFDVKRPVTVRTDSAEVRLAAGSRGEARAESDRKTDGGKNGGWESSEGWGRLTLTSGQASIASQGREVRVPPEYRAEWSEDGPALPVHPEAGENIRFAARMFVNAKAHGKVVYSLGESATARDAATLWNAARLTTDAEMRAELLRTLNRLAPIPEGVPAGEALAGEEGAMEAWWRGMVKE